MPDPVSHRRTWRPALSEVRTDADARSRLRMLVVAPGLMLAVVLGAAWAAHAGANVALWWPVGAAVAVSVAVLVLADRAVVATTDGVQRRRAEYEAAVNGWMTYYAWLLSAGRGAVDQAVKDVEQGESPSSPPFQRGQAQSGNRFPDLASALQEAYWEAVDALARVSVDRQSVVSERDHAAMLVHIGLRLQALAARTLESLDSLENDIEDPDLLKPLFRVDHLVTRLQRRIESLAVLGGAPPRQIARPVGLAKVVRQAVAEIEDFARVRVSRLGATEAGRVLSGDAVPEVIHLLAELIENARVFSPPDKKVEVRAETVARGVLVEIDDRGLGMSADMVAWANALLAAPEDVDHSEQLEKGHIGLPVAARLAQRHGVCVELRGNPAGGTRVEAVLPDTLLVDTQQPAPEATASPAGSTGQEKPTGSSTSASLSAQPLAQEPEQSTHEDSPVRAATRTALPRRTAKIPPLVEQAPYASSETMAASEPPPSSASDQSASPPARPPLPRRSASRSQAAAGAVAAVPDRAAPAAPPTADFAALFADGQHDEAVDTSSAAQGDADT